MTHRERVLAALRFAPVDRVPWVPRMDLWYDANRRRGTLPGRWRDATLTDIIDDIGIGLHTMIPDFLDTEDPEDAFDRVLGLDHVKNQPFTIDLGKTRRTIERSGDETRVIYHTPSGVLTGTVLYTDQMRRDGVSLMQVTERVVKSVEDYEKVATLFEGIHIEPDETAFRQWERQIGQRGPLVAFANVAASPMHHLLKELVPYDRFYYDLHDTPGVVEQAAGRMSVYFDKLREVCALSSADMVHFGANYDVSLTPPRLFEEHLLPELSRWSEEMVRHGKLLATHTDGENDGLCELLVRGGVHVADSVCPAPMTRLSLRDYREQFAGKIAIWGGLCSLSVLPQSFTDEQFVKHVDEALQAVAGGRGIVFSVADTLPPDADIDRVRYIGERVESLKPATHE